MRRYFKPLPTFIVLKKLHSKRLFEKYHFKQSSKERGFQQFLPTNSTHNRQRFFGYTVFSIFPSTHY